MKKIRLQLLVFPIALYSLFQLGKYFQILIADLQFGDTILFSVFFALSVVSTMIFIKINPFRSIFHVEKKSSIQTSEQESFGIKKLRQDFIEGFLDGIF